ncbi:MAG TPA: GAF domain-containing sensor histidine kinase [Coleofasciculaceae cyanobacterium]
MVISTRSELTALCRAQVALLTQGLGASFCIVYLAKEMMDGGEPELVPIVSYPDATVTWKVQSERWQLPDSLPIQSGPRLLSETRRTTDQGLPSVTGGPPLSDPIEPVSQASALISQRQVVVPLIHETDLMGLLVVGRDDRTWSDWEQAQIQQIADTLALASVLDQHNQWLEQEQQRRQQAQAQQRDLLDNLLHQFRNSLTAVQTFSKLMLKRLLPGDSNREIATSIVTETNRLQELSQHLEAALHALESGALSIPLLPGHTESGQASLLPGSTCSQALVSQPGLTTLPGQFVEAPLTLESCDLDTILIPLLTSFSAIAQEKGLNLHHHLPAPLPRVLGNTSALREVLNNVFENAVKYTPAGGVIWVELWPSACHQAADADHYVGIAISDTGPGIPPEDVPHLFERWFRGAQAHSGIPGTGLGLAIARSLMHQMNGDIQVTSPAQSAALGNYLNTAALHSSTTGPGVTLTIWVELPEQPDPHPE